MTPEEIIEIVDSRIKKFFVAPSRFISDDEVCDLLRCGKSKLRELINQGDLVQGAHFTGSRSSRLWMRDRVERYLETRDSPAQRLRDLKEWKRH